MKATNHGRWILSARIFSYVPTAHPPRPRNVALCATLVP